ncbi:uncharacterized protein PAE49_001412 [Odontesthes bonariensis]
MSLICFPNKLVRPDTGVQSELTFKKPAGKGLMGASCYLDQGSKAAAECAKRLSESSWVSEDLSCSSEMRRDEETSRGSPEWAGAVDSQRAISLDASECLTETGTPPGTSLVRSTALEDLTSIGDRSSSVNQEEALISEQTEDGPTAHGAALASRGDSGSDRILNPEAQPRPGADSNPEDLPPASRNISNKVSLLSKPPCDSEAENGSESWWRCPGYSEPDISNDSEMSRVQRAACQTSAARRSLVPVPVSKGLFAVMLTGSEPALLS